jgi:hypothetical protein
VSVPSKCRLPLSLLLYHVPSPQKYVCIDTFIQQPRSYPQHSHPPYSFDALEVYIKSQKALLARTQSDVDRPRLLHEQAAADPEHFFDSFDENFELSVPFDTLLFT